MKTLVANRFIAMSVCSSVHVHLIFSERKRDELFFDIGCMEKVIAWKIEIDFHY